MPDPTVGIDITVSQSESIDSDITVTQSESIDTDITVSQSESIDTDITVSQSESIASDITVSQSESVSSDITVTDAASISVDLKLYQVYFDFRNKETLNNNNGKNIGYSLAENGTVSWNAGGYYDIGSSTSDYLSISNNLNQEFPPLPYGFAWFEMRFIGRFAASSGTDSYFTNSLGGDDNGFRVEDTGKFNRYRYFLNTVQEYSATTGDFAGGGEDVDLRFFMYYDGVDTYVRMKNNNSDVIDTSESGDKRQTVNADITAFGVNEETSRIYFIGWRHSNDLTNADFA